MAKITTGAASIVSEAGMDIVEMIGSIVLLLRFPGHELEPCQTRRDPGPIGGNAAGSSIRIVRNAAGCIPLQGGYRLAKSKRTKTL
jgi:hypothetical protein